MRTIPATTLWGNLAPPINIKYAYVLAISLWLSKPEKNKNKQNKKPQTTHVHEDTYCKRLLQPSYVCEWGRQHHIHCQTILCLFHGLL